MFWETAFDVVSLGFSIWEVVQNPKDPWAWAGLVGDAIDLLPIVTGVGETTRAIKAANKIVDTADNAVDFTKSNLKLGQEMHKAFKAEFVDGVKKIKEYRLPSGKRIDFIDFDTKTIYELKPNNPRQFKVGTKQLDGYLKEIEELFGEVWKSVLDTY